MKPEKRFKVEKIPPSAFDEDNFEDDDDDYHGYKSQPGYWNEFDPYDLKADQINYFRRLQL